MWHALTAGSAEPAASVQDEDAWHTRQLMQQGEEDVAHVASAQELETAVLQGRRHIVLTAHIDMTALPLKDTSICEDGCSSPLPVIRSTLSIRVRLPGSPWMIGTQGC